MTGEYEGLEDDVASGLQGVCGGRNTQHNVQL